MERRDSRRTIISGVLGHRTQLVESEVNFESGVVIEELDSKGLGTIFQESVKICFKHHFVESRTIGVPSNGTVKLVCFVHVSVVHVLNEVVFGQVCGTENLWLNKSVPVVVVPSESEGHRR